MTSSLLRVGFITFALSLSGCFMSWNERGVDLEVTKEGNIFFSVLNRVAQEQGCKNINCPQLVALMDRELQIQGKCRAGRTEPSAMAVRGYVQLTAQCKAA